MLALAFSLSCLSSREKTCCQKLGSVIQVLTQIFYEKTYTKKALIAYLSLIVLGPLPSWTGRSGSEPRKPSVVHGESLKSGVQIPSGPPKVNRSKYRFHLSEFKSLTRRQTLQTTSKCSVLFWRVIGMKAYLFY